jgi:precorrin-6B methylase 2
MRILDVGSGAGDVALLLADLVGPTGSIVGIDTNAEILAVARQRVLALGWTNVSFVTGDVRTAAPPSTAECARTAAGSRGAANTGCVGLSDHGHQNACSARRHGSNQLGK